MQRRPSHTKRGPGRRHRTRPGGARSRVGWAARLGRGHHERRARRPGRCGARRGRAPAPWAQAAHDGLEIGLRAVPHLVARGGRVDDDEWFDLLHDKHGRMRDRMLAVRDAR